MFPPPWGSPMTSAMLSQLQRDLDQMRARFDRAFTAMLTGDAATLGQTPADVVYQSQRVRLLRYRPGADLPLAVPVLIVPSVLNRYYLLDPLPGRSLVEYLVGRGLDVYLLDWGAHGPDTRATGLDQYVAGQLRRAVAHVSTASRQERINLLGYGMGGTLAAIYTALYRDTVESLVEMMAPIDFHDDGILSRWLRHPSFNVDMIVDTLGSMPVGLMTASFRLLKPSLEIVQQIMFAHARNDLEVVQDLLALHWWIADTTPWLGEAFRSYVKECYRANNLAQGRLVVDGRPVKLGAIDGDLLVIAAAKDQICPPQSAAILLELVSSADKQLIELPGSHVSVIAGAQVRSQLGPQLADWLIARSAGA